MSVQQHDVHAQSRRPGRGAAAVRGPQVRLPPAEQLRGAVRELPGGDRRDASATRCRCRRCRGCRAGWARCAKGARRIIFVSEGFTSLLPPQMRDPNAQMPGFGNPAAGNPGAGSSIDRGPRALPRRRRVDVSDLRDVFDTANRNNTAIYAVDPRGLATGEFDINENVGGRGTTRTILRATQDTLRMLADNTDGRAIVNRNDLEKGLRADRARHQRLLPARLQLDAAPTDGKFHEIKVRVKRPGVQVRSRKGYWAPTRRGGGQGERAAQAAAAAGGREGAQQRRDAASATPTSRPGSARARQRQQDARDVRVGADPADSRREAPGRGARPGAGLQPRRRGVLPRARSGRGRRARRRRRRRCGRAQPALRTGSKVTFEAPPGRMQCPRRSCRTRRARCSIRSSRRSPSRTSRGTEVRLSTPAVLRARTPREFQALARDPDPVPTSLREFRRTDRLLIRFFAVVPGGASSAEVVGAACSTGWGRRWWT